MKLLMIVVFITTCIPALAQPHPDARWNGIAYQIDKPIDIPKDITSVIDFWTGFSNSTPQFKTEMANVIFYNVYKITNKSNKVFYYRLSNSPIRISLTAEDFLKYLPEIHNMLGGIKPKAKFDLYTDMFSNQYGDYIQKTVVKQAILTYLFQSNNCVLTVAISVQTDGIFVTDENLIYWIKNSKF